MSETFCELGSCDQKSILGGRYCEEHADAPKTGCLVAGCPSPRIVGLHFCEGHLLAFCRFLRGVRRQGLSRGPGISRVWLAASTSPLLGAELLSVRGGRHG